jgi:hypothetical protein
LSINLLCNPSLHLHLIHSRVAIPYLGGTIAVHGITEACVPCLFLSSDPFLPRECHSFLAKGVSLHATAATATPS